MNSISCSSIDAKPSFINDTKCSLDSNADLSSDINAKPRFDVNAAVNQFGPSSLFVTVTPSDCSTFRVIISTQPCQDINISPAPSQ